ncbi:C-type lectin domain family 4 member E-like isoform X2 [Neoarius graeffei]|uniref:C-type lectin domain family 4 member E-like isoform X2 n=1 Tax=Neoarius graeffei TaxID=443677 RepID=UPI00298CCF16|nr:C-type lectin domain family 4 member E-like isoform X2 [Neoarius graeffei]
MSIRLAMSQNGFDRVEMVVDIYESTYAIRDHDHDTTQEDGNTKKYLQIQQSEGKKLQNDRNGLQKRHSELVRDIKNGWIYFSSNLYYKSTEKKNWIESRKDCREREGDLVIIKSKEEQEFISETLLSTEAWIGLSDSDTEGMWKWVDGTELINGDRYWSNGEPNNADGNENCAIAGYIPSTIREKSDLLKKWNDLNCSQAIRWICEKKCFI